MAFNERQKELTEILVRALEGRHDAATLWAWGQIVDEEMKKRPERLSAWERLKLPKDL